MAGIRLFKRRWNIGSDDFFYPNLIEMIVRTLWAIPQLFYFVQYINSFHCDYQQLLIIYYFGFLLLMGINTLIQLALVIISSRGTITQLKPREPIKYFIYMSILFRIIELLWNIIGIVWLSKTVWSTCSIEVFLSVLANFLFSFLTVIFLLFVTFIIFDPLSNLDDNDITARIEKIKKYIISRIKFCACLLKTKKSNKHLYEFSYQQIAHLFQSLFCHIDFVPTDVLCGILLRYYNHEPTKITDKPSNVNIDMIPGWMRDPREAKHFMKYALAIYSWPIHLYIHKIRIFSDIFPFKAKILSFFEKKSNKNNNMPIIEGSSKIFNLEYRSFKHLAKIDDKDIFYINFNNEINFVPFCVLADHEKKVIVVAIRGSLSLEDYITDISGVSKEIYINEDLGKQQCHSGMLSTSENLREKLQSQDILGKAFKKYPKYDLLITGHSLGACVASVLSLILIKDYPNLKCIAYSPSSGVLSKEAVEFSRKFILSVVFGDDIISRLSIHSIHNFAMDIIEEIHRSIIPKYKILWKYLITSLFNRKNIQKNCANSVLGRINSPPEIKTPKEVLELIQAKKRQNIENFADLQMPGNIMYIYRLESNKKSKSFFISTLFDQFRTKTCNKYNFKWANQEDFKEIILTDTMIIDHLANNVYDALEKLEKSIDQQI